MTGETAATHPVRVYLEASRRRTFMMAIDWPGWGRSGRDAESATETFLAYRARYAVVARDAGVDLPSVAHPSRAEAALDVVARVPGNATTEFGAPGVVPAFDADGWTPEEARRQTALLVAAWARFDA